MRIGVNGRFRAARLAGVQRVAHELTRALQQQVETVLFLPADAPEHPDDPATVCGTKRGHVFEQIELNTLARDHPCDVLLHPANTAPASGGPHIVLVHDVLPLTNPEWFTHRYVWWQRQIVRRAVRNAAHVLTCSSWSAREIARVCEIPAEMISLIPQGIAPFDGPGAPADVAATLARYGITQPYVLATGWGDPRKNLGFLLPVIEAIRNNVDLKLVVLGAHQRRVHRARELNLPAWAQRIPAVSDDELRALYTGAVALCFPSLAEGFGRPPLEAISCGTPALVSDYAAAEEVLGGAAERLQLDAASWQERLRALVEEKPPLEGAQSMIRRMSWSDAADRVIQVAARVSAVPVEVSA
jgi:glycosyltransferase involved in cell wall biosynthesis